MSKEKQIDIIIDLLTEFDEMGFMPTTTVPDPEAFAIKWREKITNAFDDYRKQSEGEWEMQKFPLTKCSVCGTVRNCEKERGWKFCPECGAKMKGGA